MDFRDWMVAVGYTICTMLAATGIAFIVIGIVLWIGSLFQ